MSMFDFAAWLLNGVFGSQTRTNVFWSSDDISPDAFANAQTGALADAPFSAPTASKPMWQQAKDQVANLQKVDPNFSDVAFLEQASKTYVRALTAEGDMNASELDDAATQAFCDCLTQKIKQWQSAGLVRKVCDVKLDAPMLFKVSVDGTQQLITVRFTGSATQYTADANSGVVTDGSQQPQYFTEFATFVRPAGTTTPPSVAAGAPSHCPACGAPLDPGLAVCPYCNTPLSGTGSLWQIDHTAASPYT